MKALEVTWLKAYNPTTESGLYAATPNPVDWTDQQERKLGRFLRYKTAHTNNVIRCRKAVEDFRKARLHEKSQEAKTSLARERFEFQKKKAKPAEPNWKEHLASMRQQAIDLGFVPPNHFLQKTNPVWDNSAHPRRKIDVHVCRLTSTSSPSSNFPP